MPVRSKPARWRHGVATVEFVSVAMPLLIVMLGVWEVGRMIEVQQFLTNATREGGRQASAGKKTASQVQDVVVNYLGANGIPVVKSNVIVTNLTSGKDPTVADQLDHLRVTVTVQWSVVQWTPLSLLNLTGVSTMQGSADWFSCNDVPISVDQTIPVN